MSVLGRIFSDVPWLRISDLRLFGTPSWAALDELASSFLGQPCIALPSVRVGLCWALEARGYARHRDHILVPRFVGRCILNSVGRFALPVESPTVQTRLALVVDQFGRRQNLGALEPRFAEVDWPYIEDSPYGLGANETPGHSSLGRFVGLGKVLPVVQGALFVAGDQAISAFIKDNRQKSSPWALPVWLTMLMLRKRFLAGYAHMADAVYEMYPAAKGGCAALRRNFAAVFERIDMFERESESRLTAVIDALRGHVLVPNQCRLGYVVPFLAGNSMSLAQEIFRKHGFNDAVSHVDLNANMLSPDYAKVLLIPLNPYIPKRNLESLLSGLKVLIQTESLSISLNQNRDY